ncbi:class I SAM-dependent methyltransferase [Pseudoxanthomonas sp. PXM02]|uniref:methyltransferase domain-containing protein n=1 Tax=Pseudoxanthomonas sp. PXM02 TaxID=2769294 RepID=UPI001781D47F|nr:class I SAM-dependent methyltransferase [Pseudoxanthomonas sp. PXM02]
MSHDHAMSIGPTPESGDAWSTLWRAGVLHSCSTAIDGNYDGEMAAFWKARFDGLGTGQRVVDIGTGNGALALLAKHHAAQRGLDLDIHGVDAADIDPPRWASGADSFAGITFHPRTGMDTLPFDDGSVALVTSQYAFEYSRPRDATLHEVFRVIGSTGSAAFLIHSSDSLISSTADQQREACDLVFDRTRILDLAHDWVSSLVKGTTQPPRAGSEATSIHRAFQQASTQVVAGAAALPEAAILRKTFHYLHTTLEHAQTSPAHALEYLARARADLEAERVRLQHLSAAIMALTEIEQLRTQSIAAGYGSSVLAPLDQSPGSRMGWTLVVSR